MVVFVLLESGQTSPICVVSDPYKVHSNEEKMPADGKSILPQDAKAISRSKKALNDFTHRELVAEWTSEMHGTIFRLVAYVVL